MTIFSKSGEGADEVYWSLHTLMRSQTPSSCCQAMLSPFQHEETLQYEGSKVTMPGTGQEMRGLTLVLGVKCKYFIFIFMCICVCV